MAGIKRSDSNYVRSAYRRSGSGRPDYGRSKNRGQIWSIIIVLLLIVVLAGGAVWMYLNRSGEEGAVVSEEAETVSPEVAEPGPTEPALEAEPPPPRAEEEVASAAPSEEEDEFASILEELGGIEEPTEEEAPSREMAEPKTPATEAETAMRAPEETPISPQDEPQFSDEELAVLEKEAEQAVEEKADQLTEELSEAEQLLEEAQETKESFKEIQKAQEEELAAITPSKEKAPPKPAAQEGFPKTVTVQSGDSLSLIAKRVYGDVDKWRLIYEANQDRLENPNQLLVGMELTVPAPK
ncbi:Peptidoglycan-binding LysM [Nitrosococcus halophilus Nc 4]|uniref:Peptidoglycan-binding LysM n=1 Tax=Nitrosococcus halophilus (strain Nc4) TaxID=472759 RepID=D5BXR6_NITHN|nr:LysM peptidoglycan-binding domain-containing protein [Nitrosococcus halophilus]ADE14024.1 Peptidoglycan-binding LysM [Nitrosococcus halophilus Nc 4]